jgi:hypothetical protein
MRNFLRDYFVAEKDIFLTLVDVKQKGKFSDN